MLAFWNSGKQINKYNEGGIYIPHTCVSHHQKWCHPALETLNDRLGTIPMCSSPMWDEISQQQLGTSINKRNFLLTWRLRLCRGLVVNFIHFSHPWTCLKIAIFIFLVLYIKYIWRENNVSTVQIKMCCLRTNTGWAHGRTRKHLWCKAVECLLWVILSLLFSRAFGLSRPRKKKRTCTSLFR